MQELGIEKPWLPHAAPAMVRDAVPIPSVPAAVARMAQTAVDTLPAVSTLDAGPSSFVRAGALARESVGKSVDTLPEKILDTVAAAAQATTLEDLALIIATCNACSLCHEREHVVVGQGVTQPAMMVIGEAPSDQEDRQGIPFVGRSGMLLDNMLTAIGSSRTRDVYVANTIKCRPPGNRNPKPSEIAACRPFLMRQIELVKPFSVMAMGRFAAHALLGGDAQLSEMRGKSYSLEHAGMHIPVVVSYHPAYLLRQPADKAAAWQDVQRARHLSKGR